MFAEGLIHLGDKVGEQQTLSQTYSLLENFFISIRSDFFWMRTLGGGASHSLLGGSL